MRAHSRGGQGVHLSPALYRRSQTGAPRGPARLSDATSGLSGLAPTAPKGVGSVVRFEGGGCVESVVDDDEVVLPACGQGDGVVPVFVVGEVDGVVGVGDVELAKEPGDVELSLSRSAAIFMARRVSVSDVGGGEGDVEAGAGPFLVTRIAAVRVWRET